MALPDIKVDDTVVVTNAGGGVWNFRVVHVDPKSFPLDTSLDWSAFNTDSVVVKRRATEDAPYTTVYTNAAVDVQQTDGRIAFYDPKGAVQVVDAVMSVDTGAGQHMEVRLKAGPIRRDQST